MAKTFGEEMIEICGQLGWTVYACGNGDLELRKMSPAGEDFSFCVAANNFVENVRGYASSFNVTEHVKMWLNARPCGQPDAKGLINDAEAIERMLIDLAEALEGRQHAKELKKDIIEYREIHSIVYAPDNGDDGVIDKFLADMEYLGYEVEVAKIMDFDDKDEVTSCARSNIRHSLGVGDDD